MRGFFAFGRKIAKINTIPLTFSKQYAYICGIAFVNSYT